MARGATFQNIDGLRLGYGKHTDDSNVAANAAGNSPRKTLQMEIVGTSLELTTITTAAFPPQAAIIPRGSKILSATFVPTVGFTGATATLNIGTYANTSDVTVVADVALGITSATAVTAIDAIGEVVNMAGTLVGAVTIVAGATSDTDVWIGAFAGTALFTGGRGILTIEYLAPAFNASAAF